MEAKTQGVDHIGLTVCDLEASANFFEKILGWKQVGGYPDYPSVFMSDGTSVLTLWQKKTDDFNEFDRQKNIGLHHLALKVATPEALKSLFETVKEWPGVVVEFAPEFSGNGPKEHFMINEPGGTRLEIAYDPR